jgi:hypothetical protein
MLNLYNEMMAETCSKITGKVDKQIAKYMKEGIQLA